MTAFHDTAETDMLGAVGRLAALLDSVQLPPLERLRLTKELASIRVDLASNPPVMQRLTLAKRLSELRRKLMGDPVAAEKKPEPAPERPDAPQFGLTVSGIKTREKINAQVRGIVARVKDQGLTLAQLSEDERAALAQYSGRGGLTDNSQSEYYTPTPVAEGVWELMAENGGGAGNMLEPSTGAGVFSATKPKGIVISGAEIDETSSAVAQLLHPEDRITNTSFERYAMSVPDGSFDGCAGNVPFGVRGREAHHDPAHRSEKRMERYFVRRVIDKVRPGGLIVLIVPVSVIGNKQKGWATWRAELSLHAEFLGGHKLPSKTFGKQGTDVVTDIIVLRKHPAELAEKIQALPVDTLRTAGVLWQEWIDGRYFEGEGRQFIHGTFVPRDPTAVRSEDKVIAPPDLTDEALKRKIAARFESRIDWDALEVAEPRPQVYAEGDRKVINGQPMELRAGQWVQFTPNAPEDVVLDKAKFGVSALQELESLLTTPDGMLSLTSAQAYACWRKYPHLFSGIQQQAVEFAMGQPQDKFREVAYRGSLLGAMVNKFAVGQDATDRLRVIELLKAEFTKYGHPTKISGMVLSGEKARDFGAYLAAIDSTGRVADTVSGEVTEVRGFDPENVLSIVAHLIKTGAEPIEVGDVAKLYGGPRKLAELGDVSDISGVVITPDGFLSTAGEWCNGDVYDKVGAIQAAMSTESDARVKAHWQALIDRLMGAVRHTDITAIGFGLRDNWIPARYKLEFLGQQGLQLTFRELITEEVQDGEDGASAAAPTGGVWGYAGKHEFSRQLVHYMTGRSIGHNLKDRADSDASERKAEYQEKVNGMEEQFRFFMQAHRDGVELAATYDMTFNRHVVKDYDTSDLGLKGVSAGVKTHPYQNSGVRRLSDEGNGILGFDVGLGKTFSALAFSAYDRQMGRSKKHCIVVPKSVLANWYMESKKFLGNHDGVLFVGFEPKRDKAGAIVTEAVLDENSRPKRNEHTGQIEYQDVLVEDSPAEAFAKMHSIPAKDGGLVVMTYEKFKVIPVKPETVEAHGEKWVERSMASKAALAKLTEGKAAKAGSYAEKQQIANLEFGAFGEGTKKKGELPYFEDMGFDRVIVDEAHNFRASFQVKEGLDKLAYLPNPAESQRAQDMAIKLAYLRDANGGKGSILLTATPVANSPIEIYNMLMHVCPPEELDKLGIYTPADFVRFFGKIETVQKLLVTGEIGDRDGLKGFRNLGILRGLFHRYANMLGPKDVDPEGNVLKLPEAQEVKSQAHMTSEQSDAYIELREEAKKAGNPKNIKSGEARPMFAVLRDMDRVTTDIDLYRGTMTFLFRADQADKVRAMIDALPATIAKEVVDEETDEKVKIDVPKESGFRTDGETIVYVAPDIFEYAVVSRLKKFGITYTSHPIQPKYAELIKNLKAEMAANGKQIVFTEEKSQHGKLERLLIENLPEADERIGIINADTAGGEKLQEIADAFTRGDYRIIIANKKAEVGVNLQRGTTAVHHMTLPWTPASIQQRNGRAVRQGNKAASVRVYYYQAAGSFDEYRLDLLKKKGNWINALLSKDNGEDEHDNENAGSEAEYGALLSDNREEFLAKLADQQAKREAAAKERRDQAAKVGLMQLTQAREFLRTFDQRKAMELARVADEVEKARKSLATAQSAADTPDKAALVARRAANVKRAEEKLAKAGPDMDKRRADADSRVRQISASLRSQASRGELPFSAAIVDSPEDAVVTLSKAVVSKGALFEVGKDVFRIVAVNAAERTVEIEVIVSEKQGYGAPRAGTYDVDKLIGPHGVEVHLSEDEISIRKVLMAPQTYRKIAALMSKDAFLQHRGSIRFDGYVLVETDAGGLKVVFGRADQREGQMVYPDASDSSLRGRVAALYAEELAGRGAGNFPSYAQSEIMPALFGEDWRNAVSEFVKTAKREDVTAKAAELLSFVVPAVVATEAQAGEVLAELANISRSFGGGLGEKTAFEIGFTEWLDAGGYANRREAISWAKGVAAVKVPDVAREAQKIRAEAAAAEERNRLDAMRSDPRFRDLNEGQELRFQTLGLVAMYNNGERAGKWPEFSVLTLKDKRGKAGVLYPVKEILKPRFGAQFIGTSAAGYNSPYADTWAVPSRTDVDALLDFLES